MIFVIIIALCLDHLVGGGDPICGSVFFRPLLRAGLVVFDPFFLAKCNFVYVRKAYEKLGSFSECFGPQNSLLLSGVVSFPEIRGTPHFWKSLSLQK